MFHGRPSPDLIVDERRTVMYSSQGLADWELISVSGGLAVLMLGLSAMIGADVAYIAGYEPHAVAEPAVARGPVTAASVEPIEPAPAGTAFALNARALAG